MRFNKKAIVGEVSVTFWATVVLVIIIFLFVSLSGFIKIVQLNKGGTMVRQGSSTGVGDIFLYQNQLESLNEINFLVKSGDSLISSMETTNVFISSYVQGGGYSVGSRTLFKFRNNKWIWSSDGLYWIPAGERTLIINGESVNSGINANFALVNALEGRGYSEGVSLMKENNACDVKDANFYSKGGNVCEK